MSEQSKSSYRQVFKATSIFGGVQVFNIVVGIVRSKLVASLIGTAGYGINSLLTAPLGLIGSFTGLGISFSAIRNISEAHGEGDQERFSKTIKTFRRWVWITGLLGVLTTIILSPFLSQSSFGNYDYTWAFVFLSVTFLLNSISSGQSSVLYATRRIKDTSRSTMIGGILGLFTSVPLFYFYGVKGIVPAIILGSCSSLFLSWYFSRKVPVLPVKVSYKESFNEGLSFAKVGFMMTLSGLMGSGVAYLISAYISHMGGVSQVGLYNSGWNITERYVGMVFAAMAADYYPRLAAVNRDNIKVAEAVNQQAEIGLLILGPIMIFYLLSLPVLIPLLYSKEFLSVIPFTQWVVIGMLLKVVGWSLGFIALAKGKSALYFKLELIATIIQVLSIMIGYYLWGLEGIGIAFVILYVFYVMYLSLFYIRKYNFSFSPNFLKVFCVMQGFCLAAFFAVKFCSTGIGYTINGIILILSSFFSLYELDKRIGIRGILKKMKEKWRKQNN